MDDGNIYNTYQDSFHAQVKIWICLVRPAWSRADRDKERQEKGNGSILLCRRVLVVRGFHSPFLLNLIFSLPCRPPNPGQGRGMGRCDEIMMAATQASFTLPTRSDLRNPTLSRYKPSLCTRGKGKAGD